MLDELRDLFNRALVFDWRRHSPEDVDRMIEEWNEAVAHVQKVFDRMTDKDPNLVAQRRGTWDLAKDPFGAGYVKCSRCGYKHCPEYYPDGSAIMHLFCPSCGAKMDGGQDNGTA